MKLLPQTVREGNNDISMQAIDDGMFQQILSLISLKSMAGTSAVLSKNIHFKEFKKSISELKRKSKRENIKYIFSQLGQVSYPHYNDLSKFKF
jgi:hypothetical protein